MRIDYVFDVNEYNWGKLYTYEADMEETKKVIKRELNKMSKEELIEFIFDTTDQTDLEEYFEEEIKVELEDYAREEFYAD